MGRYYVGMTLKNNSAAANSEDSKERNQKMFRLVCVHTGLYLCTIQGGEEKRTSDESGSDKIYVIYLRVAWVRTLVLLHVLK